MELCNTSSIKIYFIGSLPDYLDLPSGCELIAYNPKVPPFRVDALLVLSAGDFVDASVELLRRSGRPVLNLHSAPAAAPEHEVLRSKNAAKLKEWLGRVEHLPRTNYQPINCSFYDNFEAAIVQHRAVELVYRGVDDTPLHLTTRLNDLRTDRTEEYVQLADREWVRLDRIVSVDGILAGASCRF